MGSSPAVWSCLGGRAPLGGPSQGALGRAGNLGARHPSGLGLAFGQMFLGAGRPLPLPCPLCWRERGPWNLNSESDVWGVEGRRDTGHDDGARDPDAWAACLPPGAQHMEYGFPET